MEAFCVANFVFCTGLVGISCLMLASEKSGPRLPSEQPAAAMVAAAAMAAAATMAPAGAMAARARQAARVLLRLLLAP